MVRDEGLLMGKWDKFKGKFPRRPVGDDSFVARVAELRAFYAKYPIAQLADEFVELQGYKDEHEEAISQLNVKLEAVAQVLHDQLEAQDLSQAMTSHGQKLGIKTDIYPSITDPEAFERHLRDNPDLQYLKKVHPASLGAFVRDLLERGKDGELPPGISIFFKSTVGVRKS